MVKIMDFNSLEELYKRVLPALRIKSSETKEVTEQDIWDYLAKTKWNIATNLTLYDIVNDILTCDVNQIKNK